MNYMERIMKAMDDGAIKKGSLVMPNIQHQKGCKWQKGLCTCLPDITIKVDGKFIEIDKDGNVKKKN